MKSMLLLGTPSGAAPPWRFELGLVGQLELPDLLLPLLLLLLVLVLLLMMMLLCCLCCCSGAAARVLLATVGTAG